MLCAQRAYFTCKQRASILFGNSTYFHRWVDGECDLQLQSKWIAKVLFLCNTYILPFKRYMEGSVLDLRILRYTLRSYLEVQFCQKFQLPIHEIMSLMWSGRHNRYDGVAMVTCTSKTKTIPKYLLLDKFRFSSQTYLDVATACKSDNIYRSVLLCCMASRRLWYVWRLICVQYRAPHTEGAIRPDSLSMLNRYKLEIDWSSTKLDN